MVHNVALAPLTLRGLEEPGEIIEDARFTDPFHDCLMPCFGTSGGIIRVAAVALVTGPCSSASSGGARQCEKPAARQFASVRGPPVHSGCCCEGSMCRFVPLWTALPPPIQRPRECREAGRTLLTSSKRRRGRSCRRLWPLCKE